MKLPQPSTFGSITGSNERRAGRIALSAKLRQPGPSKDQHYFSVQNNNTVLRLAILPVAPAAPAADVDIRRKQVVRVTAWLQHRKS